jgi:hypothetical protein
MNEDTCPTCHSATDLEVKNLYEEIDRLKDQVKFLREMNLQMVKLLIEATEKLIQCREERKEQCQQSKNLQSL